MRKNVLHIVHCGLVVRTGNLIYHTKRVIVIL